MRVMWRRGSAPPKRWQEPCDLAAANRQAWDSTFPERNPGLSNAATQEEESTCA